MAVASSFSCSSSRFSSSSFSVTRSVLRPSSSVMRNPCPSTSCCAEPSTESRCKRFRGGEGSLKFSPSLLIVEDGERINRECQRSRASSRRTPDGSGKTNLSGGLVANCTKVGFSSGKYLRTECGGSEDSTRPGKAEPTENHRRDPPSSGRMTTDEAIRAVWRMERLLGRPA